MDMFIFVPDNYSSTMEDRNYYLTLSDINFNATSVSGTNTNTQMVTSDDATTVHHVIYKDGTYSQSLYFQDITEDILLSRVVVLAMGLYH